MAALITADTAEFAGAVAHGKLAGIDVGTKTIGLAVCDAGWHFAGPSDTIRRTKFTADLEQLKAFVAREHVVGLVVGLPLNMDGTDSPRTQSVRAFARKTVDSLTKEYKQAATQAMGHAEFLKYVRDGR